MQRDQYLEKLKEDGRYYSLSHYSRENQPSG
jgi:hypothetical protein